MSSHRNLAPCCLPLRFIVGIFVLRSRRTSLSTTCSLLVFLTLLARIVLSRLFVGETTLSKEPVAGDPNDIMHAAVVPQRQSWTSRRLAVNAASSWRSTPQKLMQWRSTPHACSCRSTPPRVQTKGSSHCRLSDERSGVVLLHARLHKALDLSLLCYPTVVSPGARLGLSIFL